MAKTKSSKNKPAKAASAVLEKIRHLFKRLHSFQKTALTIAEMLMQNLFPQFSFRRFRENLRRKPAFWISVSALVLLILFSIIRNMLKTNPEEFAVVEQGSFAIDLIESGEVEAISEKAVTAPETYIEQIQVIDLVPEGTMVKKGDFLVQFDAGDLDDQKTLAEAKLASARADFQKLLAQQSLTLHNLENNLKLNEYSHEQAKLRLEMSQFESDARKEESRLQLKQAEINFKSMQEQLVSQKIIQANRRTQMESTLRQQLNEIKSLRTQISRMHIVAPDNGLVVYKEVGSWQNRERLKIGYKARHGEAILSVPDLSRLQIKLFVNEADRSLVFPGQEAEIMLDAYPRALFHGSVQSVSHLAQNTRWNSKLKGFVVLVSVKESDARLKPGMSAKVRIFLETLESVCIVPVGVVFEVDGKPAVFPRGKTRPVFVTPGPRNDEHIVIDKGVKRGMKLSWHPVNPKLKMYGQAEEKRRINLIAANLEKSLSLFEKQGTIYDYSNPNKSKRRIQDRQGLPGNEEMLRRIIRGRGSSSGNAETGQGGTAISSEMLDRMTSQRANRREGDGAETRQGSQRRTRESVGGGGSEQAVPGSVRVFSRGEGEQETEITPEMRERFRQMRQRRQGGDSTVTRIRQFRRRRGSDSSGNGQSFEITPAMRERMRQRRQRDSQSGVPSDSTSH